MSDTLIYITQHRHDDDDDEDDNDKDDDDDDDSGVEVVMGMIVSGAPPTILR